MNKKLAQEVVQDSTGQLSIAYDWNRKPLPSNIELDEMSYPDTSYSFSTFFSKKEIGFRLGFASGNYGHGIFTTGEHGEINIGKFVVLQCTRIISNLSVTIGDHCMFSWGSVITDSWLSKDTYSIDSRRKMLADTSRSDQRIFQCIDPQPVVIEENVWVGFEAIILPGVRIGRGSVIGCKTVVTENVPPYAVVVGNPARVIKYLDPVDTAPVKEEALGMFTNQTRLDS